MPATPTYALPYPAAADPADVPTDMQELADRIENRFVPGAASGQVPLWDNAAKLWTPGLPDASKIAEVTLASPASAIDFQSIPATFAHLLLLATARTDQAVEQSRLDLRFNGDSGANQYATTWISQQQTSVAGSAEQLVSSAFLGSICGANAAATRLGIAVLFVPNYASATQQKCLIALNYMQGGVTAGRTEWHGALWISTAAINRLQLGGPSFSNNFIAGTRATLYGLK